MVRDPVCGMSVRIPSGQVDENKAAGKSDYRGKTYYFCSPGCKVSFDKEPQKYADKDSSSREGHEHKH